MRHHLVVVVSLFWPLSILALPEPEAGLGHDKIDTLSRMKRAGSCTTTADCVSGNVCSKWGWCQWTNIYGEDGPSQGASAPGQGVAGQCVTSADCASRVPYCSKLGFCHGGRLPFDEVQLEIPDEDKTNPFPQQPQGFINNNPPKNNPIISQGRNSSGGKQKQNRLPRRQNDGSSRRNSPSNGRNTKTDRGRGQANNRNQKRKTNGGSGNGSCPGGNIDSCIDACIPIQKVKVYGACVTVCGKRC